MVEVDGFGLANVATIVCRGVDVFVDLAGVKRCVVVIADGEGYDVGSRGL